MDETYIRLECMKLAVASVDPNVLGSQVIQRAEEFKNYVMNGAQDAQR